MSSMNKHIVGIINYNFVEFPPSKFQTQTHSFEEQNGEKYNSDRKWRHLVRNKVLQRSMFRFPRFATIFKPLDCSS